jgi:hypothetical protein
VAVEGEEVQVRGVAVDAGSKGLGVRLRGYGVVISRCLGCGQLSVRVVGWSLDVVGGGGRGLCGWGLRLS